MGNNSPSPALFLAQNLTTEARGFGASFPKQLHESYHGILDRHRLSYRDAKVFEIEFREEM